MVQIFICVEQYDVVVFVLCLFLDCFEQCCVDGVCDIGYYDVECVGGGGGLWCGVVEIVCGLEYVFEGVVGEFVGFVECVGCCCDGYVGVFGYIC